MKKTLLSLIVMAIFAVGLVSAVPQIVETKLDGDILDDKGVGVLDIEKGDEVTLKVEVLGDNIDRNDIQIDAVIRGYEHGNVESLYESSDVFKLKANTTHRETLRFNFPKRLDSDRYTIRVEVAGRDGTLATKQYEFDIEGKRHDVGVDDVIFTPSTVEAGRAILSTVRVENFGEKDEEGVKVTLDIPALNLKDSKYIDEVEEGEEVTSEELFVRIPPCTTAGDYRATVTLTFNDGYDTSSKDYTITVVDGGLCTTSGVTDNVQDTSGKTIITVAGEAQDVVKGTTGAVYPLTLTNTGSVAKTYTIVSTAGNWADVTLSPSNVVILNGGESKAVFAHVKATDNAQNGAQVFSLSVKSADNTLKELVMKANVMGETASAGSSYDKVKRGLEVGLVVLVVLLVILGLVIGFNRLKDSGEDENEGQTYY